MKKQPKPLDDFEPAWMEDITNGRSIKDVEAEKRVFSDCWMVPLSPGRGTGFR